MANKKAVLQKPTPDASLPRNAFDRESMRVYHYSLGQLIPAWWEIFTAGSHVKLNRKIFQRTADLNTASFPMIDTHIQYYAVPLRLLWSLWDDFRLGIKDVNSTALINASDETVLGNITMPNRVPYTSYADICSFLLTQQASATPMLTDIFGNFVQDQTRTLLNLLGYSMPFDTDSQTYELNLWPILAYNKIYYDHFRNSAYENNFAKSYNMDYLWARNRNMKIPSADLANILQLKYVNYRADYFTNLYPSLNYVQLTPAALNNGVPGTNVGNGLGFPSNVVDAVSGLLDNRDVGIYSYYNGTALGTSNPNVGTTGMFMTLSTLRTAFALDKLMRSSAYTPLHVKDQYEARYGIKFPKNNSNESIFVGAYKNDIQIGEVTATSATNSTDSQGNAQYTPVGAIHGKGVGFDDWGKTIEFNCVEDCIIMAIQYSTIRSCYRSLGFDSYLTKHLPEDYFVPEYQNLGLEPVYGMEFNKTLGTGTVLGYRPRNQRYKLGIDKSYQLFADY